MASISNRSSETRTGANTAASNPDPIYLNQTQLGRRWGISVRSLERWRWLGRGPDYVKIGGSVRYRLSDVEAYEAGRHRRIGARVGEPSSGRP
jgi:hypothetical protein